MEPIDETLTGRHRVYKESDSVLSSYRCGMYSATYNRLPDVTNHISIKEEALRIVCVSVWLMVKASHLNRSVFRTET